jgi:hypothetical protein
MNIVSELLTLLTGPIALVAWWVLLIAVLILWCSLRDILGHVRPKDGIAVYLLAMLGLIGLLAVVAEGYHHEWILEVVGIAPGLVKLIGLLGIATEILVVLMFI